MFFDMVFELRKAFFDGIEKRRIRWQILEFMLVPFLNPLLKSRILMDFCIVHY